MSRTLEHPAPDRSILQGMYRRYMAGWAGDALLLRRRGLDRPTSRGTHRDAPIMPGRIARGPVLERADEDQSMIRWRPEVDQARA